MPTRLPVHNLDPAGEADGKVVVLVGGKPVWGGTGSSGTIGGELLMQDGVTGPPVPIETEARDDWLYEG